MNFEKITFRGEKMTLEKINLNTGRFGGGRNNREFAPCLNLF